MISGKIYRFRANDSVVDPRFLEMYLLSPPAQQALERMKTGISDSGLNLTQARFLRLQVPVPPLAEQRRIVDLLEDHLSRLDNALNSAKTAQRRIRVLTAHAMWSLTHDLGGVDVPLATIAEVRLGRQRSPKNHSGDRMRPYLRAANVNWNRLVLDDVKSMNFTAEESAIYTLRDGDILLTEASGSPAEVGKSAIYRGELVDACFQNTLVRVRRHEGSPEFLHYYLLAEAMRGRFIAEAKGVNIAHLGRQRLAKWPVQLPSDDRQADAVSRVAEVMQSIERLQVSVSNVVRRERTLRGSIFQAAFTGGLTRGPQSQFGQELASV
ncbi:restriction endonuclease subunit S [Modestobacter sp. SYSU DS0511]